MLRYGFNHEIAPSVKSGFWFQELEVGLSLKNLSCSMRIETCTYEIVMKNDPPFHFEGPRERLLAKGTSSLSDLELVAILLRTGYGEKNVLEFAGLLCKKFGPLQDLMKASQEELKNVRGIGPAKLSTLLAMKEIAIRFWRGDSQPKFLMESSSAAYRYFSDIALRDQEVLVAAFLNSQLEVILRKEIFIGTLNGSLVSPRELLKEALRVNAAKILIAHNHPSQNPEPSEEDRVFTSLLDEVCKNLGVMLLDHLIICSQNRFYSFRGKERINFFPSPPSETVPENTQVRGKGHGSYSWPILGSRSGVPGP